ncbi:MULTISPECIES: ABC transporter substrate-binding protein [unclassified Pseudofrankia]|uniref:ABC transporter substrate-binding protein n=1 Tax=unclassified Pseudofrankia TaxID=2994372 RepID=UPI0008D93155|nr:MULTISPECIES: ABC transporter substrate-binding protein [unclassified Pseudofrankia]MDT3439110.1 ABC transporter substrate-binding protein [Pseudofrankia sp. BMG5.37]OHV45758.1 branched-chain amino acid ABC transporter substrate-binding protein [Pseudofrankia sp. BMG5.36]
MTGRLSGLSRSAGLSGLVLALAATVGLAACGSDDGGGGGTPAASTSAATSLLGPSAPAKGAPVKIGIVTEGKSQVSDMSAQNTVADGTAKWLNEHRAGIAGRPIELVKCDALGDPGKATDCGNKLIEAGVVAAVFGESAVMQDAWKPLHDAGIPVMLYATSERALLADKDSTFILSDPSAGPIAVPIQVAKDKGYKKVTSIVIDVPAALGLETTVAPGKYKDAGLEHELIRIPPGTADMTPQLGPVVAGDPGMVFVLGNDSFCISAFNGLRAVGYTGQITSIAQCITDATRKAVPGDLLKGIEITASAPIGTDNPSTQLYKAVVSAYAKGVDTSQIGGMSMFSALAGFQIATSKISGDVTPASILSAVRAMPEAELPGAGGLKFKCDGKATPLSSAVCTRGSLAATLDAKGNPSSYELVGTSAAG